MLIRVAACGVRHTGLDETEGQLPPSSLPRIPGHQVVGSVWTPVIEALDNLAPGGRLVINAIRKESGDRDALLRLD